MELADRLMRRNDRSRSCILFLKVNLAVVSLEIRLKWSAREPLRLESETAVT